MTAHNSEALAVADVVAALIEWRAASDSYAEALAGPGIMAPAADAASDRLNAAENDLAAAADVWLAQLPPSVTS